MRFFFQNKRGLFVVYILSYFHVSCENKKWHLSFRKLWNEIFVVVTHAREMSGRNGEVRTFVHISVFTSNDTMINKISVNK